MHVESPSEKHGIEALRPGDELVLSVGVSTGGDAEIRMARLNPNRKIIATTLDEAGAQQAKTKIAEQNLNGQITVKIEDVSDDDLPYADNSFDYVYARLVLHYLSAQKLQTALGSLYRILKPNGRLFVVVRSAESEEAKQPENVVDEETQLTTYKTASGTTAVRYFHTQETIGKALEVAGFKIDSVNQFDEQLSPSFNRDNGIWVPNIVIEIIGQK